MSKDSYIHKVLPGSPGGPLLFVFHGTGGDEAQLLSL
ncbi:MAG: alpha/beta hydrolase, partial [Mesorhizobium sp.]